MKKIAVFVEGQTERIFMLRFLSEYLGENKIEIHMEKRLGNRGVKYLGMRKNPYAEFYILVYDVGGDGNVVSAVKERCQKMINNAGYSWILALCGICTPIPGLKRRRSSKRLTGFLRNISTAVNSG